MERSDTAHTISIEHVLITDMWRDNGNCRLRGWTSVLW